MYILSFYTINALKTQKNGRLLCIPFHGTQYCVPVAQPTPNNITRLERYPPQKQFCGLRESLSFINVSTPLLLRLHTFLPPADAKKLPHIKNVREAFSVICYLALILAF